MAAGDKLGKITLETAYTTSGVDRVTSDVKEYTNVVINNLQKLRDFVGSKDPAKESTARLDSALRDIEMMLIKRAGIEKMLAAQQQQSNRWAEGRVNTQSVQFLQNVSKILTSLNATKSLGKELGGVLNTFTTIGAAINPLAGAIVATVSVVEKVISKLAELNENYNQSMVSAKRISFMLYSNTSMAQNVLRQAAADAHRFGMTLQEVLSFEERLSRLSSLTEELNFPQLTETALKMSLATGRSGEEIAANIARVIGMLRSGSGSARALVSLGLSGGDINKILESAKSGTSSGREEAIDLFIKTLTERFQSVKEEEFITPGQRLKSKISATEGLAGENLNWIGRTWFWLKELPYVGMNYWFTNRETFEAIEGAADRPATRVEDTDIRDYAVGQAWQRGLLRKIDPTGELFRGYDPNRLMDKTTIGNITGEYNKRVNALKETLYLEASRGSILKSENLVLAAQFKYVDMIAEARRKGAGDLEKEFSKAKTYFNLQVDFLSRISKPMEDVLNRGLFGVDETRVAELYQRLDETSDPEVYRRLVYYYEKSLQAQLAQGKITEQEYFTRVNMLNIMKEQSGLILKNLERERQLKKELEEQRRAKEEWEAKLEDFKKGSSREQTIRSMLEEIKLYNAALQTNMDPARARETYNERMFSLLQSAGLLNFRGQRGQSTPLPGLFTYGSVEAIREINRIRTFGVSRNSMDEMIRNIREQLKLDAQNINLLEAIKQVLIEMRDKIPGAGK